MFWGMGRGLDPRQPTKCQSGFGRGAHAISPTYEEDADFPAVGRVVQCKVLPVGYRLQSWKRDPESYATDLHGLHHDIFVYVSFWTDFWS